MTRQARHAEAKGLKKNQVPEGKAQHRVETSLTKPYQPDVANNLLIPLSGTAEKQTQPLKVPQLQAIQLQQFAITLGSRQGNRSLASLVQRQAERDTANNQRLNQVSGEAMTETASVQSQAGTNSTEAQSEATTKESELTSQAQANEAQVRGQAAADEAQSQAQINAQQSAMESQAGELQAEMQGEYAAGQGEANNQAAMIQAGAQTGERE
jgi:hypothetical protein